MVLIATKVFVVANDIAEEVFHSDKNLLLCGSTSVFLPMRIVICYDGLEEAKVLRKNRRQIYLPFPEKGSGSDFYEDKNNGHDAPRDVKEGFIKSRESVTVSLPDYSGTFIYVFRIAGRHKEGLGQKSRLLVKGRGDVKDKVDLFVALDGRNVDSRGQKKD